MTLDSQARPPSSPSVPVPLPGPGWIDEAALADFVPLRPQPVAVLPAAGRWRVRTEDATVVFDVDAGTVRRWAHTRAGGPAHPAAVRLVQVQECAVGAALRFTVAGPPAQQDREAVHGGRGGDQAIAPAATATGVQQVEDGQVIYLESLELDRAKRAREHVAGWGDVALPDPLRAAHLCAASYFGATRSETGQVVGLSGRQMRDQFSQAVMEAMVRLRTARGEPERVPLGADGRPRRVPRWMTEERVRRREK